MEWENETREADPKQTWPEDLVSWPSLNLRGFLPSDARPIISDSGFLSFLTKKNNIFSVYESFSDVGEIRVYFASKILTPCRMH